MKLQLTRSMLAQLLGDEQFYEECPYFLHMRELGLACYRKYMDIVQDQCDDCQGQDVLRPAITAFINHCVLLKQSDPSLLTTVRQYVGQ